MGDNNNNNSNNNTDVGKLFVGGIPRDTREEELRQHFTKYGKVSYSCISKDRMTGNPRGFGFVSFEDPSSLLNALSDHPHVINGRTVEVKKAIPRNEQTNSYRQHQQSPEQQLIYQQGSRGASRGINGSYGYSYGDQHLKTKKIFVGGLSASLTEELFRSYFEKFGRITDVVVMHDNTTNRPRGFGFITFDSEEVVEEIVKNSHHELAGKHVEVKKAIPREMANNSYNGNNSRMGGGRSSQAAGQVEENSWPRGHLYGSYSGHVPVSTSYPMYYYASPYGTGGYPVGGFGAYGYGVPMVATRSPWDNGVGAMGFRPVAYGTGYYPSSMNGGVAMMGMVNPYSNFMQPIPNGKQELQAGSNRQPTLRDTNSTNGGRSRSVSTSKGDSNSKKSMRSADAQA